MRPVAARATDRPMPWLAAVKSPDHYPESGATLQRLPALTGLQAA